MSIYPNANVYVVRVTNKTYVAFLENQDGSRIKFFGSGEVIPAQELKSYIARKYGKEPDWVRCMFGDNHFYKDTRSHFQRMRMGGGYNYQEESIRVEFDKMRGQMPSTDYHDYDTDNDYFSNSRKEERVLSQRMNAALEAYEARASQFPSFASPHSVTESEICEVMEWYARRDKDGPTHENYGSVLDF